jgi:hypothetical protein
METISEHHVSTLRWVLRLLSFGAMLVHVALCIFCIVKSFNTPGGSPHYFSFYRARVSGERVAASQVSFVDKMLEAAGLACPLAVSHVQLLSLETTGDAALGLDKVRQTWIADKYSDASLNGFWVLVVVFAVSAAAQGVFWFSTLEEKALETFRQPVLLRWIEYAMTSPLQIVLVASCVMVRDVHTILLLGAAQFSCVLLGYPLEYMVASADLEDPVDLLLMGNGQDGFPIDLAVGKVVSGPPLDARFMASHEQKTRTSWCVCFCASLVLHVVIWGILLDQLHSVEKESGCHVGSDSWRGPLRAVVVGQCVLFSCFAVVPLAERVGYWTGEVDAGVRLLYCSLAYSVLSVVAKSMLAASYVAFMELFPFATRVG